MYTVAANELSSVLYQTGPRDFMSGHLIMGMSQQKLQLPPLTSINHITISHHSPSVTIMITSHFFGGSLGITISPSTNRYFDEINFHGQCERHAPRINPADIVVTLTRGRLVWISSLHLATFMDSPDLGAIFFPQHPFFGLESDRKLGIKLNPIGTPWLFNNLRKPWPMKIDDYIILGKL